MSVGRIGPNMFWLWIVEPTQGLAGALAATDWRKGQRVRANKCGEQVGSEEESLSRVSTQSAS